jgi:hypothetical protein
MLMYGLGLHLEIALNQIGSVLKIAATFKAYRWGQPISKPKNLSMSLFDLGSAYGM